MRKKGFKLQRRVLGQPSISGTGGKKPQTPMLKWSLMKLGNFVDSAGTQSYT